LQGDFAALGRDRRLRHDVNRATELQTGLACFDAWAEELVETGYLHNHARMWFASIWIFTLGLPGGWARISSIATFWVAMRRPTHWAGAGSPGRTRAANLIQPRH